MAEPVRQTYQLATQIGFGDEYVAQLFDVLGKLNDVAVRD